MSPQDDVNRTSKLATPSTESQSIFALDSAFPETESKNLNESCLSRGDFAAIEVGSGFFRAMELSDLHEIC